MRATDLHQYKDLISRECCGFNVLYKIINVAKTSINMTVSLQKCNNLSDWEAL